MEATIDWTELDSAVIAGKKHTLALAKAIHTVMVQMDPKRTLKDRTQEVHEYMIDEHRVKYATSTIANKWYATVWVAENNDGEVVWMKDRTYSDHEAARTLLTWEEFKTTLPYIKHQVNGKARNWIEQVRYVVTALVNGEEMTGTAANMNRGERKRTILRVQGKLNEMITPAEEAIELINLV